MFVRDIVAAVDKLAPFAVAEPWDHVGLQVGDPAAPVIGVLVALEADETTLDEARRRGCELLLVHHPLIHEPLATLTADGGAGALALRAASAGVAVLVAHTNLDKTKGGLADVVAGLLGLRGARPLEPTAVDWLKLVGFVPADDADLVRKALFSVGAGMIGEYEHCSWGVEGQGTFLPTGDASPAIGEVGRDETVDELRLEMVFPRALRRRVVAAYVAAHPYEEPAFDIIPVENVLPGLGLGRVGELPHALQLAELAGVTATALGQPSLRYAGDPRRLVRRVAVLPGSGGAAIGAGVAAIADVLVTGDVKYHDARAALAQGLAVIDAPHDVTEEAALLRWSERLEEVLGEQDVRLERLATGRAVWATTEAPEAEARTGAGEAAEGSGEAEAADETAEAGPEDVTDAAQVENTVDEDQTEHAPDETRVEDAVDGSGAESVREDASTLFHESVLGAPDDRYRLFTDGGARGNPGPAAIGARLLTADGLLVDEVSAAIGTATNNVAEYEALLAGLELALDRGVQRLTVLMDSELVVRQLNGAYKVKDRNLQPLFSEALRRIAGIPDVEIRHVPREENGEADRLVNEALDRQG